VVVTFIQGTTPTISFVNGVLSSNFASDNQWYLNDSLIRDATQQDYVPKVSGSYTVRLEIVAQTLDTSLPRVLLCNGSFSAPYVVKDSSLGTPLVVVYPSPMVDHLTLTNKTASPAMVRIFDLYGRQLVVIPGLLGTQLVDVSRWGKGTYFIEVIDGQTHKKAHVEVLKL
jgi:hypothetical protein